MMILPTALVFALNLIGAQGHCGLLDLGCHLKGLVDNLFDICYCVRTYQCYQGDISKQRTCFNTFFNDVNPDYVCCRAPVRYTTVRPPPRRSTKYTTQRSSFLDPTKRPFQRPQPPTHGPPKTSTKIPEWIPITTLPTQIRPSSSDSQPQDTSQASPPTNTDCTCMPRRKCHDKDDKINGQHKQGSCPNPKHVCCRGLVQPVIAPQPQRPKPSQTSPPTDTKCSCTPFYKCYDEEISSNLTGVVDDRISITNTDQESCPDPNDICCHNLVKITAMPIIDSSSEDCTGSCISIKECPYLYNKMKTAQAGNPDAIEELRRSVCSITNGNLRVCCPSNGSPPCQFPFIYKQVTYSVCTNKDDPNGELWCSTQTDNQSNHVKDQWRPCTSDEALVAA